MCKKSRGLILCALAMTVVLGSTAWGALVGHWKLDETSGTVAADSSGNGLNGTVQGGGTWVAGKIGGAWQADGTDDYILIPHSASLDISNAITVAFWIRASGTRQVITKGGTAGSAWYNSYGIRLNGTVLNWRGDRYANSLLSSSIPNIGTEWTHVAITFDVAVPANNQKIHVNGVLNAQNTSTNPLSTNTNDVVIGRDNYGSGRWYLLGALDDFRIYNEALPTEMIPVIMVGGGVSAGTAVAPSPADKATDVLRDVALSWTPGEFAATHDVYFGTSLVDVNAASSTNPPGVLAGAGQDANTFDPAGLLEFGRTYYWRVDEVNAAPDTTVFKGKVWSFTAETYAFPVTNIAATASSFHNADTGPQKTVDGSGLDAADLHGTAENTIWLSSGTAPQPAWIQYEFDDVYKLQEMRVWNYNQSIEAFAGLGAKSVTVEYSTDANSWTTLAGVPEFARAPGAPGYASNTTVNFAGVAAKYVKLTINSNWGGIMPQFGLSEVRFYYVPVHAREPKPASAATGVSPEVVLSWRSGREAASHQVYLSADSNAVANGTALIDTVTDNSYTLKALDLGTTYYWKVVEVNQAATPATWESDTWSFTTANYLVIDNFESYTNESPNRLFQTWIDGYGYSADEFFPVENPGNGTGSGVGHDIWNTSYKTIAETTIIHGGKQSMPLYYDNSVATTSEAQRTWKTAQNWTTNGADTLTLYFRGTPVGFAELSPGHILMNGIGADIWGTADQGRFVYKQLTGDGTIIARVDHLDDTDSTHWAKAGVMIRQSLDPSSTWALALASPGNGTHFQARVTTAASATSDTSLTLPASQTTAQIPLWVKLERKGDQFNAYYAVGEATPTTWTANPWNPQTISMNATVYVGLAVTSHSTTAITQAEFSNVAITGTVTGQWQSASLGVEQPAGNLPDTLFLTVEDSGGHKATVVNTDPYAVAAGAWTPWTIPLSALTSTGVKMDSVKKMTIGIGDSAKSASGATGLLYIDDIGYGRPVSQ